MSKCEQKMNVCSIFSIDVLADSFCIGLSISWQKFRIPTMYDTETTNISTFLNDDPPWETNKNNLEKAWAELCQAQDKFGLLRF